MDVKKLINETTAQLNLAIRDVVIQEKILSQAEEIKSNLAGRLDALKEVDKKYFEEMTNKAVEEPKK